MASSINASTSGAGGLITTADNTGILQLQSGGTTIATISSTGLALNSGNITLPSGAAPTFSAYRSSTNQSFSANTWTKVQCQTEEWDTNSNYDNSTNYRFTPTVAGYYQCSAAWSNDTSSSYNYVSIYKNGAAGKTAVFNGGNGVGATISAIIYLNGSTDYIEMYMFSNTGNIQTGSGIFFQAAMIRSA